MIVSRFAIVTENFVIGCNQVTKIFCPRYRFASSPPAKSRRNLSSLPDFAISVFGEVSMNTVFPGCHFRGDVPNLSHEKLCAVAGTSVSSRSSVNACGKRFPRSLMVVPHYYFCFGFWADRVGCPALVGKDRHFVVLLDLEMNSLSLAGTMWKTNLCSSLKTIPGQQQEGNFLSCTESFSHSWSDVAFDQRPTHWCNRVLRRACPNDRTAGVSSSICTITKRWRSWTYTCASSFVCTSPLAVITVVEFPDFRRVSSSASPFWNLPRILAPLAFSKRVPLLPMRRLGSRTWPCPLFWGCKRFSPSPMLLCGRIVLLGRIPEVSFPQILAHTDCILEVHTFAMTPCDGPFLSLSFLVPCALENVTVRFDLNFLTFRNQIVQTPSVRQLILFHHLSSTFYGAAHQPPSV